MYSDLLLSKIRVHQIIVVVLSRRSNRKFAYCRMPRLLCHIVPDWVFCSLSVFARA